MRVGRWAGQLNFPLARFLEAHALEDLLGQWRWRQPRGRQFKKGGWGTWPTSWRTLAEAVFMTMGSLAMRSRRQIRRH